MPAYDIAHIREQGVDLIIVPLDPSFGTRPATSQQNVIRTLQAAASSADLAGTVVPVWDGGGGRMFFVASRPWHPFFSRISLEWVWANINRRLTF